MTDGYSRISIILHWIAAIGVIFLFLTHEDDALAMHIAVGALLGPILIWRALRRPLRGLPPKPDQHPILNLLSTLVLWGLLLSILVVVVTGYLAPWSIGQPIEIWQFSIPSPLERNVAFHRINEELHDASGHAFVPLLLMHIAGSAKHWFFDKVKTTRRMFVPAINGH